MVCIYCGSETKVINSRLQKRSNNVWRRRNCLACSATITTHEAADLSTTLLVETKNGAIEPFLLLKLSESLLDALNERKDAYAAATELSQTIVQQLLKHPRRDAFKTIGLSTMTADVLSRFNKEAYLRYVLAHPSQAPRLKSLS
jgi:transcriptional repressor NrdR